MGAQSAGRDLFSGSLVSAYHKKTPHTAGNPYGERGLSCRDSSSLYLHNHYALVFPRLRSPQLQTRHKYRGILSVSRPVPHCHNWKSVSPQFHGVIKVLNSHGIKHHGSHSDLLYIPIQTNFVSDCFFDLVYLVHFALWIGSGRRWGIGGLF